jgi:DNA-binding NtrC family response regulator
MAASQSRLLVVDDEPCIREMMADLLLAEGYEVLIAQDGFDTLSHLEARRPDLIISDLTMPRMSGFGHHSSAWFETSCSLLYSFGVAMFVRLVGLGSIS